MKATEMFNIFEGCVNDYHRHDNVDFPIQNPYADGSFESLLYLKSWIDTVQWHLEDIIRNPGIKADTALNIKRRIDSSNQERTDLVEKIDDHYLEKFSGVSPQKDARLNTESPAWAIDRLSILALKIYHMRIEAGRMDIGEDLKNRNTLKRDVLLTQQKDLIISIDQLLEDLESGIRVMKVYRQMKMYNDPELNPVLYTQSKG